MWASGVRLAHTRQDDLPKYVDKLHTVERDCNVEDDVVESMTEIVDVPCEPRAQNNPYCTRDAR